MTTSKQYDDSEGEFGVWKPHDLPCRQCGGHVQYRTWESSDGAYEDYQYRCENGHTWWVDGIDS